MRLSDAAKSNEPQVFVEALRKCFAKYRTCFSLTRYLLARLLNVDPDKVPRERDPDKLVEWVSEEITKDIEESSGDRADSVKRMAARAKLIVTLRTLLEILAENYEGR